MQLLPDASIQIRIHVRHVPAELGTVARAKHR